MTTIKIILDKNEYPPHIQRIITEAEELDIKIEKLDNFIKHNPLFNELPKNDKILMKKQLKVMIQYLDILDQRLVF